MVGELCMTFEDSHDIDTRMSEDGMVLVKGKVSPLQQMLLCLRIARIGRLYGDLHRDDITRCYFWLVHDQYGGWENKYVAGTL
jgi:hypothetical protein